MHIALGKKKSGSDDGVGVMAHTESNYVVDKKGLVPHCPFKVSDYFLGKYPLFIK